MRARRRALLYAALAIIVPVPALALDGHSADLEPAPEPAAELAVSVALDRCGLAGTQVICKLDVGFSELPGATRYTASVSRPDGSVIDAGAVAAPGTSLWVGYVGDGDYSVEVSAYGPGEDGGEELLARESDEGSGPGGGRSPSGAGGGEEASAEGLEPGAEEPDSPGGEPDDGTGAGGSQGGTSPAPPCPEDETDAQGAADTMAGSEPQPSQPSPSADATSSSELHTAC